MAVVHAHGLDEFRLELNRMDRSWGKQLRLVHLEVAKLVQERAVAAAPGRAKRAIKARATQRAARLDVVPGRRGDALAVIMGQDRRSGWYGFRRYRRSTGRQFDPWVGTQWDPGSPAAAPYYVGPAINQSVDDVVEVYGEMIDRLARRAFPAGSP